MRIVVGITGASGSIYGLRLIERLRNQQDVETHLVLSRSGEKTRSWKPARPRPRSGTGGLLLFSRRIYAARLASGSYPIDAMVVAPCSIHTMSAIATRHHLQPDGARRRRDPEGEAQADSAWCARPRFISDICGI